MFNATGLTQQQVAGNVINRLVALRAALEDAHDLFRWSSGIALADLTAVGFSPADAQSLLTAIADANALYVLYNTGQVPAGYPQATAVYVYSASQAAVVGPQ